MRLWDIFDSKSATETLTHSSDVVALSFRPDGKELCVSTLDGNLHLWDAREGYVPLSPTTFWESSNLSFSTLFGTIEGRKDLAYGNNGSKVTQKNVDSGKCFSR